MKKIRLNFEWWDAVVEIDYNENTLQWMKDQLLFWSGGQEKIDDEEGNIEQAYLKMLAQEILPLSQSLNLYGLTEHFKEAEGWAALNDDFGVKLVSVEPWNFETEDIQLVEI